MNVFGETEFADASDDCRIAFSRTPELPGKPRLVLIHSLAMDRYFWEPVAKELEGKANVLALDCRGHGESDKPAGPYSVERFADDVVVVFEKAGWDESVVAGSSMGGCVALSFAAARPDKAIGLGLIDTTAWYGPGAEESWAERAAKAEDEGMASLTDFQVTRWFSDGFRNKHPDKVDLPVQTFLRNDVDAYAATCNMLGTCDLRDDLEAIDIPTRIIVGEEDYATPLAMSEAMHREIEGSTLTVLEGVRHFTPLECPEKIAAELNILLDASNE